MPSFEGVISIKHRVAGRQGWGCLFGQGAIKQQLYLFTYFEAALEDRMLNGRGKKKCFKGKLEGLFCLLQASSSPWPSPGCFLVSRIILPIHSQNFHFALKCSKIFSHWFVRRSISTAWAVKRKVKCTNFCFEAGFVGCVCTCRGGWCWVIKPEGIFALSLLAWGPCSGDFSMLAHTRGSFQCDFGARGDVSRNGCVGMFPLAEWQDRLPQVVPGYIHREWVRVDSPEERGQGAPVRPGEKM